MGSRQAENVIVGGGWSFLWVCVDCGFKPCKEAVEVVEQRDVVDADLWRGLVVCDRLNALPQAPGVSAVFEVAGYLYISYLYCIVLFCFPDATGQVGSRYSQASFIPGSEGVVSGTQQQVDIPCQPWLPVRLNDDSLCVSHIIDALPEEVPVSVYSSMSVWLLYVAPYLNISQSVVLKQS